MMARLHGRNPSAATFFPLLLPRVSMETMKGLTMSQEKNYVAPHVPLEKKLQVPTYQFLKEALIRKYGQEFYDALDKIAQEFYNVKEAVKK